MELFGLADNAFNVLFCFLFLWQNRMELLCVCFFIFILNKL